MRSKGTGWSLRSLRLLGWTMLSVLTAGCSESQEMTGSRDCVPVKMNIAVQGEAGTALTRVVGSTLLNTQFSGGEVFYARFSAGVTIDDPTVSSTATVDYTFYTVDASNPRAATPNRQPFVQMENSTTKTVATYFPYMSGKLVTNTTTKFSVELDQNLDEKYTLSDLMYGEGTIGYDGVVYDPSTDERHIVFQHRMAKLIVTATPGSEAGSVTEVAIVSGYRTVNLGSKLVPGTTLEDGIGDGSAVVMYSGDSETKSALCSALLPPQTLGSQNLLRVKTKNGSEAEKTAYFRLDSPRKIESGKSYAIGVTIANEATDGKLATVITDWQERPLTENVQQVEENLLFSADGTRAPFRVNFVKGQGSIADFYLGETEVTNAQWQELMEVEYKDVNLPVSNVSRSRVTEYITLLNRKYSTTLPAGWVFDLPTKAQWQWAYRGGAARSASNYTYSGSSTIGDVAWYSGNSSSARHDVAEKDMNELGLFDMAGNVSELVKDETDNAYGGNYGTAAANCKETSAITGGNAGAATIGFRLAMVMREGARIFGYNGTDGTDGAVQVYEVPASGNYLLEAWGAEGGSGNGTTLNNEADPLHSNSKLVGGQGGYAKTVVSLTAGEKLYVYVGGKGGNGNYGSKHAVTPGGWNGGGKGGKGTGGYGDAGGGGGATFIAKSNVGPITSSHSLRNASTGAAETGLLLVAGGGGGFAWSSCAPGGGNTNPTPEKLSIIPETSWAASLRPWILATFWVASEIYNPDGSPGMDVSQGRDGASTYTFLKVNSYTNNNTSGCAESNGGGGGGFQGGNARQQNGGAGGVNGDSSTDKYYMYALRTSTGGCGGSSWAAGTLVTSESAWADAVNTWFTATGVRKGHGRVVITPL